MGGCRPRSGSPFSSSGFTATTVDLLAPPDLSPGALVGQAGWAAFTAARNFLMNDFAGLREWVPDASVADNFDAIRPFVPPTATHGATVEHQFLIRSASAGFYLSSVQFYDAGDNEVIALTIGTDGTPNVPTWSIDAATCGSDTGTFPLVTSTANFHDAKFVISDTAIVFSVDGTPRGTVALTTPAPLNTITQLRLYEAQSVGTLMIRQRRLTYTDVQL